MTGNLIPVFSEFQLTCPRMYLRLTAFVVCYFFNNGAKMFSIYLGQLINKNGVNHIKKIFIS